MAWENITFKTTEEIAIMKEGGRILAGIMDQLKEATKIGVTTQSIDDLAEKLIKKYQVKAAFKDHEGYPAVSCLSVNNVIVHSVPSDYILKAGDLISIDMGIQYQGFFTDMAITVGLAPIDSENNRMIHTAKKALKIGIANAKVGNTFSDIGNAIQRFVEYQGFGVVRELCGHGIGHNLHEEPKIPNYGSRHKGPKIEVGMVFCIEPMITRGDWHLKASSDGFGYETADGSYSAHYEHTLAITDKGTEILTIK
ncbi:MAG: type I methionyl aminopeptidase [Candidatus Gribaldobacteria bacterium]|nr:type I methionyl aminopeptidase [Candidatus Gribaldobacteria bacterium]